MPFFKNHEMCPDMSKPGHGQGGPQHMFKGVTKTHIQKLCRDAGCNFVPGGNGQSTRSTEAGAKRRREGKGRGSKGKGRSSAQRPRTEGGKGGKGQGGNAGAPGKGSQ